MLNKGRLLARVLEWRGILVRHWRIEVAVASLVLAVATIVIVRMPDVYRAETRILVNPQTVSNQYVNSAASINSTDRLNTLSQQVLSSSRLQVIIDELHLFPKLRLHMGRDQLVELMRGRIGIDLKKSGEGPSSFSLSYTGDSAQEVADVTERLAQSFIDWNSRDRAREARGTTDFLASELATTKQQLDDLEERLRSYKLKHLGELPAQIDANMQTLSRLQMQLQGNMDAQNRLDHEAFLANVEAPPVSPPAGQTAVLMPRSELFRRDAEAHRELEDLRKRYTEDFPAVATKLADVHMLDAELSAQPAESHTPLPSVTIPKSAFSTNMEPRMQLIARDRARLIAEQRQIEAAISAYQSRVNSAPIREQEISQLLRDYDTAKEHYRSLLEKTYSAQMAAELETKQQGGSFTVLDPATVPDLPIGPDRQALMVAALLVALVVGLTAAVIREALDITVHSEESLRELVPGVPLLGMIPKLGDTFSPRTSTFPNTLESSI